MSQQITNHEDMQLIYKIEEVIISLDLSTQKAISLMNLGVNNKEAFSEAVSLANDAKELLSNIKDELVRTIANEKIYEAVENFESKMSQIRT